MPTIVNRTTVSSASVTIPPTTEGNTLVAIIYSNAFAYINSSGTSLGSVAGRTIYDGIPFTLAAAGPANPADSAASGVTGLGALISYLESVPAGITSVQFLFNFYPPPDSTVRGFIYELTPSVFDVTGTASTQSTAGGVTTTTGAVTPFGEDVIAFAPQFYTNYPTGSWGGMSWPQDASTSWTPSGSPYAITLVVGMLSSTSGSTSISVSTTSPIAITYQSMTCFRDAEGPIRMVNRSVSLASSGSISVPATGAGNLLLVVLAVAGTVTANNDDMLQAESVAGGAAIWYAISRGDTTLITFTGGPGAVVYEFSSTTGTFELADGQNAPGPPVSGNLLGTSGVVVASPVLSGTDDSCIYLVVGDSSGGMSGWINTANWEVVEPRLGSSSHRANTYIMRNQSGAQQFSFFEHVALVDAVTPTFIGVVFKAVGGGGGTSGDAVVEIAAGYIVPALVGTCVQAGVEIGTDAEVFPLGPWMHSNTSPDGSKGVIITIGGGGGPPIVPGYGGEIGDERYPKIIYPQSPDVGTQTVLYFTYPSVNKPGPYGTFEQESVGSAAISISRQRQVMTMRVDEFMPLKLENVPWAEGTSEDMSAWQKFMQYALTGGSFLYYPSKGVYDEYWIEDGGGNSRNADAILSWAPAMAQGTKMFSAFELVMRKVPGGLTSQ